MSLATAIFLGALQGVTEFLPVSSSGHLVLAQHFLGFAEDTSAKELFFDGVLHLGTNGYSNRVKRYVEKPKLKVLPRTISSRRCSRMSRGMRHW